MVIAKTGALLILSAAAIPAAAPPTATATSTPAAPTTSTATPPAAGGGGTTVGAAAAPAPRPPRFPGFAAALAEQPAITGPDGWPPLTYGKAWAALARATPDTRQATRWDYARSLVGTGRGAEALGVLDVMNADDPDLALVPAWQLARGAALAQLGRPAEAMAALAGPALAVNAEAALWRMRALADAGMGREALAEVDTALPAINARPGADRVPLVIAAAGAALAAGQPQQALTWLALVPDRNPAANLLRGRALLATGQVQAGQLRLDRVALSGSLQQRLDAQLSGIEAGVAGHRLATPAALKQLDHIRFAWRGGPIEQRALQLTMQLSAQAHDTRRSLAAGATLFRYFSLGSAAAPTIAALQAQFTAALAPDSGMPLDQAAGLYWEFRDLAPAGAEGDLLVNHLADRLQAAGLYGRAAELLGYQMSTRPQDVTRGPLSIRVATLDILAGRPDRALQALRDTAAVAYPDAMAADRHRIEAAALHLLGRTDEALAVLQDVPDGGRIGAELLWQKRDWAQLVAADAGVLPRPGTLNDVDQTIVLRHAIALAMLGREGALAGIKARYGASFARLPTAATFDLLTRPPGSIDPAALGRAMAALPSASPAGAIGDLLDVDAGPSA